MVPDLVLSHSTLDADVFEDPEVFAAFLAALVALVDHRPVGGRRGLIRAFGCCTGFIM